MASDKQELWLSEYLRCLNATEAARRAGYKWPDKIGAANKALYKDEIARILAERIPSPEAVVSRVADMAMADMTDYLREDGSLDLKQMKADGRGYLLKRYKHTRSLSSRKDGSEHESEVWETELYPADGALDKLMRYHGLYNDRLKVEDWQSEVVDGLRDGRLTPAEVSAAWPELAAQFFAKAGISVA